MKLLIDARVGWGHGIGRVVSNVVPRMAGLRPDWQIDVLVGPADVEVAEAAFAGHANLSVLPCAIEPFTIAEQTSLETHARDYDLTWFTNYWVPLTWRGRFVATVHDMLHLIPKYFPSSVAKRVLARQTFHKLRRNAEAIVFVSRFTQQAFGEMIGTPRRGEVVHLGGDHLHYDVKPIEVRKRQLLVVAASKRHKNFAMLLQAWQAADVADHWTLVIISPGSRLRSSVDVEEAATQTKQTMILRDVSNEELSALYSDSAILLMPSLYEGFGLPLLEGLLAGALCISSNAGAMIEVGEGSFIQFVNGSDTAGWIASIEDACASIDREDPAIPKVLALNVERARRLRWADSAAAIVGVLEVAAR